MDKSYVSMEQHQCPICLTVFETGAILLDQRLRNSFERHTLTGHSPCAQCQEQLDQDFVALIETADTEKNDTATMDVPRSGNLVFMKREVFSQVFNIPPPAADELPMVLIAPGVIQQLEAMREKAERTHH